MDGGWIRLHRSIRDNWIFQDAEYYKVWSEMLMVAKFSHKPKTHIYDGITYTLNYGEFVFGRPSWSKRLGISDKRLRLLVTRLCDDDMMRLVRKYSKFTIYFVVNFEKYNQQNDQQEVQHETIDIKALEDIEVQQKDQQKGRQKSSRSPAEVQQKSNNKNVKNVKNVNKKDKTVFEHNFEILWNLYPHKVGKGKVNVKKLEDIMKQHGLDKIERCIERYKTDKPDWQAWQNGSTFFNSGYIDYLADDYNPTAKIKPKQEHDNFDQRQYSEADLEKYYVDVTRED